MALSDAKSDDPLRFGCPRCGAETTDHWYGPCSQCRSTLRASVRATPKELVVEAYEPKVNVTPNAVALKE